MTATVARRTEAWRRVFLTLATLAVVLKVLIPPGFMAATAGDAAGFPLVLCTNHGAVMIESTDKVDPGLTKKAPAGKPAHDAPCAFAGHGVAAPAPDLNPVAFVAFAPEPTLAPVPLPRDLAPGRGLAAPPLPARGPPILLT